jgi:hypothetical protein
MRYEGATPITLDFSPAAKARPSGEEVHSLRVA